MPSRSFEATELLLQERVPREVASTRPWAAGGQVGPARREADPSGGRRIVSPHQSIPATLLLSNGRYAVMLTAAGSGYSRWGDMAITRWREDATRDDSGSYIFLARHAQRRALVGGLSADRRGARRVFRAVQRGSRGVHATRRRLDDDARRAGLGRGRRRGAAGDRSRMPGSGRATSRSHPMPNWRSGRRTRTSRIPPSRSCSSKPNIVADLGAILATRRKRTPTEPEIWAGASQRRQWRSRRQAGIRNRPGALPGTRASACARRSAMLDAPAVRTRSARCSIPSSACVAA